MATTLAVDPGVGVGGVLAGEATDHLGPMLQVIALDEWVAAGG
jgi:hypothetical protein